MKEGLENAARDKLIKALQKIAGTPFKAMATGLASTMLVQSSTAVSVMSVGFVNAGIMTLPQAIGILLGANVGTCATVQIIAFDLTYLAVAAGIFGVVLNICSPKRSVKYLGQGLTGFGLVFTGLKIMSVSLGPLQNARWFLEFLYSLSDDPLLAVVAGTIASALLHSSAAATGIVMLLSEQNLLPLTTSVAIVLGNNVGTCITAVLASLTGSPAGKRVALAHVILNVAGVLIFLPLLPAFTYLVALTAGDLSRQVANAHTLFNVFSSIFAFPFIRPFTKLLESIIPRDTGYRHR